MSEWKEYILEEVIDKFIDYRGKTPSKTSFGIPLITAKIVKDGKIIEPTEFIAEADYDSWMTRGYPEINDVVLTTEAPLGEVALIKNKNVALAQRIITLQTKKEICDSIFLKYYLQSKDGQGALQARASGTTVEGIKASELKKMEIALPKLSAQKQIASILSCLDDKIDLLHRQNKTLEQLAETLFREKLIVNNEKWELKSFGEFIESTFGGEWGKEKPEEDFTYKVCCIRGTDIADLQTGIANRTPVRYVKEKKFASIEPKDGDLILEISGGTDDQSTGRTIYINELNRSLFPYPLVFSNFCRLIRPKKKEFSYLLYLYIQYLYHQDEFFNLENETSGIKNLDYKYLLFDLKFSLPKNEMELIDFNKEVEMYFEKINKNKHQIRTLTQLRDTLLPKLMSGEVRVSEL